MGLQVWQGETAMASMLEEKDAIREVLARYCFHLDGGQFEQMAALFTEDGTWHTAFGVAKGRAAIADLARKLRAGDPPPSRGVHLVTNIVIELNGDSARVSSNWIVAENSAEGPKVGSAGGYADQMVKQEGRWLFQYREIDRFVAPGR
ncbi:MAG: nuclear transport factor 2 family protein [Acetobacteraceae bacterium]|nr:nuclear transport factor 2 family protein [Acetobacteraceae bacterium]